MQDIQQETLNECIRAEQSASVVLWEIDLTEVGGDRYFFCNEQNEKGESVTWQSRQYQAYPIQGSGFEMNGKGASARPTLKVSNLHGMVTGMAEDLQSLVGGTVVRRKVYARFLDAVNFVNGNSDADPEQEVISRWRIEQWSLFRILCKYLFSEVAVQAVTELDNKAAHCHTPVPQWHRPFL